MMSWLFDKKNQYGFLPNLIKDGALVPDSSAWRALGINYPFSNEFRFLKYCDFDRVPYDCKLVSDYVDTTACAYYPINLTIFDCNTDYVDLMDESSRNRLLAGDFKLAIFYSKGDDPDPEIYDWLLSTCEKYKITNDCIRFVTTNYKLKDELPFIYFPDDEVYYRYLHANETNFVTAHNLEHRNKKFTCLIRSDKIWRKVYASTLFNMGLADHGYFSYTGHHSDTSNKRSSDMHHWRGFDDTLVQDLLSFDMRVPFKCDNLTDAEHTNHKLINHNFYNNAYFNFVVETHFETDTCLLTEKTFKPILNLQPFIIIGNPGSISLLHDLGYKTFNDVIRETYDNVTDYQNRMTELLKISFDLCNLSNMHHRRIQAIISDILLHNQRHLLAPKVNRINKLLREMQY